jgi:membrane protease YdiL (CAAX protease family)
MRRGKTFYDLGFSWKTKDFGWSILLYLGGGFASYVVYKIITFAGLTSASHATAVASVSFFLFGGGITLATILFQFLNPFFEEMIVRAYVMTELRFQTNSVSKPVIFSTLLQMSYHFYQGAPLAFSLGAGFLVFSIYYSKTNRIAPIILGHLYMDVGGTLYYSAHHQ